MTRLAATLAAALTLTACAPNTHPEPDSAVIEPAADGSHWVTPAGTRHLLRLHRRDGTLLGRMNRRARTWTAATPVHRDNIAQVLP